MIHVGVDTGKHTAVAFYNTDSKSITKLVNTDFWGCIALANLIPSHDRANYVFHIEITKTKAVWHNGKTFNKGKADTTAFNVGMVYRESQLLIEGIKSMGFRVIERKPKGKKNAAQVKAITSYNDSTNQHSRDAIMLVWGRKCIANPKNY